jgi:hypothetical protein
VQDNFICDEEEAQDVLYWALTDGHVCNTIQNKINEVSNNECLEEKEILTRTRSQKDERIVNVSLTKNGIALKDKALEIPQKIDNSPNK